MENQETGKSIYNANTREIFGKQFIAGFAHGLGGFVVTLISWVVIYFIVVGLLLPQLSTTIEQLNATLKLIPRPPEQSTKTSQSGPEDLLQQLQKQLQGN